MAVACSVLPRPCESSREGGAGAGTVADRAMRALSTPAHTPSANTPHHVVCQHAVQPKAAQKCQPVDALLLVPAERAVDAARGKKCGARGGQ